MTNKTIQTLYNKYRPLGFADLIGQEHIATVLKKSLRNKRASHAYMFCGPRGSGKTTTARILAMCMNCEKGMTDTPCGECDACLDIINNRCIDIVEVDCASKRGVDDIRELQESVITVPSQVRTKFYIMDEVHMLTNQAQNSFLKTLEEPPNNVVFILATTEPEKLKDTILSRTQVHQFYRIPAKKLAGRLQYIADKENIILDEDAALAIARSCEGGARDAISKFDTAINMTEENDNHVTLNIASKVLGTIGIEVISKLADVIINKDVAGILAQIGNIIDGSAMLQPNYILIMRYFRNLMVVSIDKKHVKTLDIGDSLAENIKTQAQKQTTSWFLTAIKTMLAYGHLIDSVKGRVSLEAMCLEVALQNNIQTEPSTKHLTKNKIQWIEMKDWFPKMAAMILSKTTVYAKPNGLYIDKLGLTNASLGVLNSFDTKIKETLQQHNIEPNIIITDTSVSNANEVFS